MYNFLKIKISENAPYFEIIPSKKVGGAIAPPAPPVAPCLQDIIQYKQSKIVRSLLTGAKKLPPVLKKLIVPLKNIHSHNTRNKNLVYKVKARHPNVGRLLKSNASKV